MDPHQKYITVNSIREWNPDYKGPRVDPFEERQKKKEEEYTQEYWGTGPQYKNRSYGGSYMDSSDQDNVIDAY